MLRGFVRAVCLALVVGLGWYVVPGETRKDELSMDLTPYEIVAGQYPEMPLAPRPDSAQSSAEDDVAFEAWWDAMMARQGARVAHPEALSQFTAHTARLLVDARQGRTVYSPLSLWLELDLVARITSGESRAQALKALGEDTVESLMAQSASLFASQYWDDGESACVPGASLWLDVGVDIESEAIEALDDRVSVFKGDMKETGYNRAMQRWLDHMTRGMLSNEAAALRFEDGIQLSLISTLYYRNRWQLPFPKEDTAPGVFHGPNGDIEADFMHLTHCDAVYRGTGFTAVSRMLGNSERVVFVLPDVGLLPADLMADDELFRFLNSPEDWADQREAMVNFSMPRLDCASELGLRESLEKLGIVDAFDALRADFSEALRADEPLGLSSMLQIARVTMDEEGVEAAAITISGVLGAMMTDEEMDFTLDRPFLFAILGQKNVPLFIGVVNEP